ncbi:MAG: alpha/beta hydrolase [Pseudomonadota bacterium]
MGQTKVLWLHGYTLDSRSWETMWSLLPGWHHIGLDLPGHGRSNPVDDFRDLRQIGQRLADVCVEHHIEHVVALSFGTAMATQLAVEIEPKLRSLVLAGPTLAGMPQDPEVAPVYQKLFMLYHQGGDREELVQTWMGCRAWRGIDELPALKESLGTLVREHSWQELNGFGMMRLMQPEQTPEPLRDVPTPTLLLVGDREMQVFKDCATVLHDNLPDCDWFTLPDTDHLCLLQTPELSAAQIARHLERYS